VIERLELPDGQWADQLVRPRHREYVAIIEAAEDAQRGRDTWTNWALVVGREFTKAWYIRGEDGQALPFGDWSLADPDLTDAMCTEAQNRWHAWYEGRRPLVLPRPRRSDPMTLGTSSGDTSAEGPSGSGT